MLVTLAALVWTLVPPMAFSPAAEATSVPQQTQAEPVTLESNPHIPSNPYIGHTGANDGQGGIFGAANNKQAELDLEAGMGLGYTWLPVHWSLLEPTRPTGPNDHVNAAAWEGIDRAISDATDRGLTTLLQIVIGGNAGGPPAWAGRRTAPDGSTHHSAPGCMDCLIDFVQRLSNRYRPGGTLAVSKGWTTEGVRFWEIDNEPDGYEGPGGTSWKKVPDDYAEFLVKSAAVLRAGDPSAVIVAPASAGASGETGAWIRAILDPGVQGASQQYRANGVAYTAGPDIDVVAFHTYELLSLMFSFDTNFASDPASYYLRREYDRIKAIFQLAGYPKDEFWHTEGGYGFIADDIQGKQNWVIQWLVRGFAAGIDKLVIMDASPEEAQSVSTTSRLLPEAYPIADVTSQLGYNPGDVRIFRATRPDGGWTYIAWGNNPTFSNVFSQRVSLPIRGSGATQVTRAGEESALAPTDGEVTVDLPVLGLPFNPPLFVVDHGAAPLDSDGDGVPDSSDNCPSIPNPTQSDADSDGTGDACETQASDGDGDGVPDSSDNCPALANPSQSDGDGDGIGDACEGSSECMPAGWESPYLGHTGVNDGTGGTFGAGSKRADFELEDTMGIHWHFLPVNWRNLQPNSASDGPQNVAAWATVDSFMELAREYESNVLLQIVVGGNAGGPPHWAGQRVAGRSAPVEMDALAAFGRKLAERYAPGGELARDRGWTDNFGVRVWEMDNEPDSYQGVAGTNWDTVNDDYAEFVTKTSAQIRSVDPDAVIVAPEVASGGDMQRFVNNTLDKGVQEASPQYIANGVEYSIGPDTDVASFHTYELLTTFFNGDQPFGDPAAKYTIRDFNRLKDSYDNFTNQQGFEYDPIQEFWHTEGGFDFLIGDPQARQNWVIQWLTRGFAAGIDRMTVMDASPEQAVSVGTMTRLLPDPFPIEDVTTLIGENPADVSVFRVQRKSDGGWTYIAWASNGPFGVFGQTASVPVRGESVTVVKRDGTEQTLTSDNGRVTLQLPINGTPFNEPVFLVDVGVTEPVPGGGCGEEPADGDEDGVADADDNCLVIANPDQADLDADGAGDACDADDDGDGVTDEDDAFPRDPNESTDTDGDGTGNNADADDDGDGQSDADEIACGSHPLDETSTSTDTDADGSPDCVDGDDDGDSVADSSDNCPLEPNPGQEDRDRDGIGNACDPAPGRGRQNPSGS